MDGRDPLPARRCVDPTRELTRECAVIPDAIGETERAKDADDRPELERAEPVPELDPVVHEVHDLVRRRCGEVFRHERERAPEDIRAAGVADIPEAVVVVVEDIPEGVSREDKGAMMNRGLSRRTTSTS